MKNTDSLPNRVLIVEDDPVSRHLLSKIAESQGCDVDAVSTVRDALEHLLKHEYSLILLDCHLTDGYGAEVARHARNPQGRPRVPVVALSADKDEENIDRMLVAGADQFLTKPVSASAVMAMVELYCPSPDQERTEQGPSLPPLSE